MILMISLPMFISFTEIAFIMFILVMVFGADKIPEIAKGLGKGFRGIKSATDEIKGEFMKNVNDHGTDAGGLTTEVRKHTTHIKEELEQITGSVSRRY